MPSHLVVPNAVQISLQWIRLPSVWHNILYGEKMASITVDQALADAVDSAVKAALNSSGLTAHIAASVTYNATGLRDVNSANNAIFYGSNAGVLGTAAGDILPTQTAVCITHRTARAGASYRGRSFVPGFTETDSDTNGHATAASTVAAAAFFNTIRTSLTTNSLRLGVASPTRYNADGSILRNGFITPITTSVSRNNEFESQRRRRS